jgi:hypothetical protein
MKIEDQTKEAFSPTPFSEDWTQPEFMPPAKGQDYLSLLVDNIVGLDNNYESAGEQFGKSFNQDELGSLKGMALGAYEGAKEFVDSPVESATSIIADVKDSVYRLGTEKLDSRLKRLYNVGYEDATEEQVTQARESVLGDGLTALGLVPAARLTKNVLDLADNAYDPTKVNIFGGLGAKQADFSAYKKARKLQANKVSPRDIEIETGWHEGPDGYWRFEIDDKKAKIDSSAINDEKSLSEILDHPELFKNYDLDSELRVFFDPNLGDKDYGSFDPKTNTIFLNPSLSDKDLKATLLHEIQHYVQFKESFINGSNPEWEFLYGNDPKVSSLRSSYNNAADEQEKVRVRKEMAKAAYAAYRRSYGEVEANVVGERSRPSGFFTGIKERVLGREPAVEALKRESGRYAEGGMVEDEQMNRLMQEGGMADDGMNREPVTGNEIPPGSLASEVRDDIPAQLSEGEYVVPADVLRYYGVRFFEDLRAQAKQGMMEMESDGRIGGTPVDAQGAPLEGQEEELTPEEEQMLQEALGAASGASTGMAMGGMIPASFQQQQQQPMTSPYQDQAMLYKPPASGMAEGGFASALNPAFGATTFDRSQFTSDTGVAPMETRQYINPTTKEIRSFSFMNGNPLSPIPDGFVPWTQELQNAVNVTPLPVKTPEPVQNRKSDGDRSNEQRAIDLSLGRTAGTEGQQNTRKNADEWAKENYEAFNADPYKFGMDALKAIEGPGKAGKIPLIGKIAGLGSDINALDNITSARASLAALMEVDPDTEKAKELSKAIDKAVENLGSNVVELAASVFFQGNNKFNSMKALEGTPPTAATAATTPTAAAPPRPRTTGGSSSNAAPQLSASDRARAAGASAAEGARIGANLTAAQAAVRPKGGSGKAKDDVATPSRPTATSSTGALKRNVRQQKANVTSVAAKAAPKKATVPTIGKGRAKGGLITRPKK